MGMAWLLKGELVFTRLVVVGMFIDWLVGSCIGILTGVSRVSQLMSCMIHDFAWVLRHEWGGMEWTWQPGRRPRWLTGRHEASWVSSCVLVRWSVRVNAFKGAG